MIVECKLCKTKFNIVSAAEIMQPSTQAEHVKQYGHFIVPDAISHYDAEEDQQRNLKILLDSKPGGK